MVLAGACAQGQTWQSENVLLPGPDAASAPSGLGATVLVNPFNSLPAPSVFLGRDTYDSGAASILLLTPTDSSSSLFTLQNLDSALAYASDFLRGPGDTLYAVGHADVDPNARNVTHNWRVRKSLSRGNPGSWGNDDSFSFGKNAYSSARSAAIDSMGNVFVAGIARDARFSIPHWIVRRKKPALTDPWTTVFDAKNGNVNMRPSACSFPGNSRNPTSAIFTTSDLNSKWTVMRSQQLGDNGTWQEVDSWTGGGTEASPCEIRFDPFSGNLYVAGFRGLNGKNPSGWVMRMSPDGGNSWTPLLDAAGASSWASKIAIDGEGNVTVSGVVNPTANTPANKPLWKVIRCTDPTSPSSWAACFASADTLPFGENTYAKGYGISADSFGNVFATGLVSNWTDTSTAPATVYSGDRVGLLRLVP